MFNHSVKPEMGPSARRAARDEFRKRHRFSAPTYRAPGGNVREHGAQSRAARAILPKPR